jgi:hypothetical protein
MANPFEFHTMLHTVFWLGEHVEPAADADGRPTTRVGPKNEVGVPLAALRELEAEQERIKGLQGGEE